MTAFSGCSSTADLPTPLWSSCCSSDRFHVVFVVFPTLGDGFHHGSALGLAPTAPPAPRTGENRQDHGPPAGPAQRFVRVLRRGPGRPANPHVQGGLSRGPEHGGEQEAPEAQSAGAGRGR